MPASKFNTKTQTIIVTALRNRASLSSAAGQAGVTYNTLYNWMSSEDKRYAKFQAEVARAEAEHEDYLRGLAEQAAFNGDGGTIRFLLERRFPKTYANRQSVELSGPDGGPIQTQECGVVMLPPLDNEGEDTGADDIGEDP